MYKERKKIDCDGITFRQKIDVYVVYDCVISTSLITCVKKK